MDAEERTQMAITITRTILEKALDSPFTMAVMTTDDLNPEHLQDNIYDILGYLEKTKPEKTPFAPGIKKIKEDVEALSFQKYLEMLQALEGIDRTEEYTEEELARMNVLALKVAEGLQQMREERA